MHEQLKQLGVTVKTNVPLAKYTTYKIGGPARYIALPSTIEEMVKVLSWCDAHGVAYLLLGSGSNMLASDEGFDGVVIHPQCKNITVEGTTVIADAGALTVAVARASVEAGLTGFEWAVGVPGTIGGAVRGNAGCLGGEVKDSLAWAEVYYNGERERWSASDCAFGYRDSRFKHTSAVVLRAAFELKRGVAQEGTKRMIEFIQYRNKTQPKIASCGCMFKNVPLQMFSKKMLENIPHQFKEKGIVPAGWLVQEAGCKGMTVGGAQVSTIHGNFFVNNGSASADDVMQLVSLVCQKVRDVFGVELQEEIQMVP